MSFSNIGTPLRRQRTVVVDGKKYRIVVVRRTWFGNFQGHKYSIKGPDLDFESFTNVVRTTDSIADELVEKVKKWTGDYRIRYEVKS